MKKKLLSIITFCATCLVIGAQAQSTSGGSSGSSGTSGYSGSSGSSSQFGSQSRFGATGRMSYQEVRASKIQGAQVSGASGENLGTISDVILNPASGRIDFAVISLSPTAGGTSSTGTSSTSSTSDSSATSAAAGGQLVPVPWTMLRPASSSANTSATSAETGQLAFTFTGDTSKLQGAPSFSQSNWPDISQPGWRHSIFSYYGMTPGASTGGALSPGGTSSGSEGSSSSPSSSEPSSGSSSQNPRNP